MKKILGILSIVLIQNIWAETTKVVSPDGKYTAVINTYENDEAFVTVTNKNDKPLAFANFQSQGSEHGKAITSYKWTDDSKFFVFITTSSGGHSPLSTPAYFYSRKSETFRSVDLRAGFSTTGGEFKVDSNDVITVSGAPEGTGLLDATEQKVSLSNLDSVRDDETQE